MSTRFITTIVVGCIIAMFAVVVFVVLATGVEHRAPIMDTSYLGIVRPQVKNVSDNKLIDMGHTACQGFQLDEQRYEVSAAMVMHDHITAKESTVVIDTAISNYCPQFKGR